jgi:hypothetical protein
MKRPARVEAAAKAKALRTGAHLPEKAEEEEEEEKEQDGKDKEVLPSPAPRKRAPKAATTRPARVKAAAKANAARELVLRRPARRNAVPKAAAKRTGRAKAAAKAKAGHEEDIIIPSKAHGFAWKEGKTWAGARCPVKGRLSHHVFVRKIRAYATMCDWLLAEDKQFRHSEKLAREFNDHLQAANKSAGEGYQWATLTHAELDNFLSKAAMQFALKKWPGLQESIERLQSEGQHP